MVVTNEPTFDIQVNIKKCPSMSCFNFLSQIVCWKNTKIPNICAKYISNISNLENFFIFFIPHLNLNSCICIPSIFHFFLLLFFLFIKRYRLTSSICKPSKRHLFDFSLWFVFITLFYCHSAFSSSFLPIGSNPFIYSFI